METSDKFSAVLLPVNDQPLVVWLNKRDYLTEVLKLIESTSEQLDIEFLTRKYYGPVLYHIKSEFGGPLLQNSRASQLAGFELRGPALLCHIEKEADLTRLPDLTLEQMENLIAKATDIRFNFMRNYWRSLKQTRKFSAEQLPAEFPEFKDSKQWLGKTPVTLVNEYIQGNKQLSVEYERVSTNDMGPHKVHIKVQHGDEELTFKPDEFHAKQQDARQNAALQFIKWLAHWQMTGEKLVLREDCAAHDTDAESEEDEHEPETERVTLKEEEELTAPMFAYFDFVRAMAQQFKLNHEAEVWSQHAPVAVENKTELEGREVQDMLGDLSLMKIILEPGHKLVEGDVKAYRVHYVGVLQDETVFDSTFERDKTEWLKVDDGIDLMAIGLRSMRVGERALIWGTPERCFKEIGSPPRIPPNAHCLFYLHLLEVKHNKTVHSAPEKLRDDERLSPAECVLRATANKQEGNALYGQKQLAAALSYYNQGIKLLQLSKAQLADLDDGTRSQFLALAATLHFNAAAVYMELKEWNKAARHCSACLEKEPSNVKAWLRSARIHVQHSEFDRASSALLRATELMQQGVEDVRLRDQWHAVDHELKTRRAEHTAREKKMYRSMFE
jgi:FK506-binding protein 6